jgi:hypothetical protein
MSITRSHLRRLTATILIGCVILLPAFIGRAAAQSHAARAATMTVVAPSTAAL